MDSCGGTRSTVWPVRSTEHALTLLTGGQHLAQSLAPKVLRKWSLF